MLRQRIHNIIFESDTVAGRLFDVTLLALIVMSTVLVLLDSVPVYHAVYGDVFWVLDWGITILFSIEYGLRIYAVQKKTSYVFSFFGIVDILSIIPTYLSLFFSGTHYLGIIRAFRLLRIFRIFNLKEYLSSGIAIQHALLASYKKIVVFLLFIILAVFVFGGVMYVVENGQPDSKFDSIPNGIYWAIVTITTVGYGDISPVTPLGRFIASVVMILGYAVIAVPTGIVSGEIAKHTKSAKNLDFTQHCNGCGKDEHQEGALYCDRCGTGLRD